MIMRRIAQAAGLACLLVGASIPSAVGQEIPAADATLKSHELKRLGSTYVLPDEAPVLKRMKELASLQQKVNEGLQYLDMIETRGEQRKVFIEELSENHQALQAQLQEMSQQIAQIEQAGINNPLMSAQRNQVVAQHNAIIAADNQVVERLNSLRRMEGDRDPKHQVVGEVTQRREEFLEAMLELRKLVDAALARYQGLAQNDEVVRALNDVSAASKSKIKYKLGPSRDFLAAVQRLEKAEGVVSTDAIKCRREGGVFVVDAMINGKLAVPMIYDTGASEVVISTELADRLGIKPKDSDPVVPHQIADGSIVNARKMVLESIRVGKVVVKNIACSVMPSNKTEVPLLLGQGFLSRVDHKMSSDGRLTIAKVDQDQPAAKPGRTSRQTKAQAKASARTRRSRGAVRNPATTPQPDVDAGFFDPE